MDCIAWAGFSLLLLLHGDLELDGLLEFQSLQTEIGLEICIFLNAAYREMYHAMLHEITNIESKLHMFLRTSVKVRFFPHEDLKIILHTLFFKNCKSSESNCHKSKN